MSCMSRTRATDGSSAASTASRLADSIRGGSARLVGGAAGGLVDAYHDAEKDMDSNMDNMDGDISAGRAPTLSGWRCTLASDPGRTWSMSAAPWPFALLLPARRRRTAGTRGRHCALVARRAHLSVMHEFIPSSGIAFVLAAVALAAMI